MVVNQNIPQPAPEQVPPQKQAKQPETPEARLADIREKMSHVHAMARAKYDTIMPDSGVKFSEYVLALNDKKNHPSEIEPEEKSDTALS